MAIRVQLFGGEKDGDLLALDTAARPDVIYACHTADDRKPRKKDAAVDDSLCVLAYKFRCCADTEHGPEYRYDRCPEKDKAPPG